MDAFAATPAPPYYAVIFSSQRSEGEAGYNAMAERMVELAAPQPGYLGIESCRGEDGFGITVSYWRSEADIVAWKRNAEHSRGARARPRAVVRAFRIARGPRRACLRRPARHGRNPGRQHPMSDILKTILARKVEEMP